MRAQRRVSFQSHLGAGWTGGGACGGFATEAFQAETAGSAGVGANIEHRIQKAGITDLPGLFALNPHEMRTIWGSVWGEKMWYLLRGMELPDEITARRSVGHSHVMAPELRDPIKAKDVARRLTLKAASRLRRMEYYAGAMSFSARLENDLRVHAEECCYRAQDNKTFLDLLDRLWT